MLICIISECSSDNCDIKCRLRVMNASIDSSFACESAKFCAYILHAGSGGENALLINWHALFHVFASAATPFHHVDALLSSKSGRPFRAFASEMLFISLKMVTRDINSSTLSIFRVPSKRAESSAKLFSFVARS